MDPKQFGQFISDERAAKGLTQKELAEKLGVTDKAISKWERGVCLPDVAKFDDIAAALDLTDIEVLRAHRLPPEEPEPMAAKAAPPFILPRELGRVLLGCFLLTIPHFILNVVLDMAIPFDPAGNGPVPFGMKFAYSFLRIGLYLALGIWLALREAQRVTTGLSRRSVFDCAVILAALFLIFYLFDGGVRLLFYPDSMFGTDEVLTDAAGQYLSFRTVWYQQYLRREWTPKLLLFIYLNYEVFDLSAFWSLLLCLGSYPVTKLLCIYYKQRKQIKTQKEKIVA